MLKKILKFVPGVIVPLLISFLLTILYARFLDPDEYGILSIYLNTIQIVYAATLSVFQTAALRFYSIKNEYRTEEEFIATYIFANFFVILICACVSIIFSVLFSFNAIIIVFAVGCNGLFQFIINIYRLKVQTSLYNLTRIVSSVLAVIILILLAIFIKPLTFIWPIIAVYGSYGLLTLPALWGYRHSFKIENISVKLLFNSIKYGFPLIGVTILGYVIASCDQFFLLYFLGDEAVGNYALGQRLVDAVIVNLLMLILLVMTPELNKTYDQDGKLASAKTLENMISLAVWIIIPITFAIILYAQEIIEFIFPKYNQADRIMQLVVFSSMFHGISMFTCKGLELIRKPRYIFYSLVIATIINCVYNAIFIPIYGINASAHSSLIAYIIYNLCLIVITKKYYKLMIDARYCFKVIFTTFVTITVGCMLKIFFPIRNLLVLLFEGIICLAVYLLLSYLMRLLTIMKNAKGEK